MAWIISTGQIWEAISIWGIQERNWYEIEIEIEREREREREGEREGGRERGRGEGSLWGVENDMDNLNRPDLGGDIHLGNPGEELV